jgi:hypothetical protein
MTTDQDIHQQVTASLADYASDHDVAGIVRDIISTYGLVDIDNIVASQYWDIVQRHAAA